MAYGSRLLRKGKALKPVANGAVIGYIQKVAEQTQQALNSLESRIPKKHEIESYVRSLNESDRREVQALRDSAIKHLQELERA